MNITGNVLIVDDEPGLRQTLTRVLRQAGFQAEGAGDGGEALQRLAETAFDIVYLDIHLPDMGGLEVLEEVHRREPELPVILFTAYATLQSALKAIRLGAMDYLLKPVDPETLISRTRVVLMEQWRRRRRLDLEEQIDALRVEIRGLGRSPSSVDTAASVPCERFFKLGSLVLDLQTQQATFGNRVLDLPPTSFDYLLVLGRNSPDTVSFQTLVKEAQGYQTERRQAQELSKWHIHNLRMALERNPRKPRYVLNTRGVGYRLVTD